MNNINVQNNGHMSTNNIPFIVRSCTQINCSPYSTHSRDEESIKPIPSKIENLTTVNSETKYQQYNTIQYNKTKYNITKHNIT